MAREIPFTFARWFDKLADVIDTGELLEGFLPHLRAAEWVALDTEADSLHAYPEKLCLIQISVSDRDELLDPLSDMDLSPLLDALRGRELILHGADYDLRLLRRSFNFAPTTLFDTMLASRLLGDREFGLTNLVRNYLGVTLEKGAQKANWARRPLTERMAVYARNDTHYLKPLSDLLRAALTAKGRLLWHQQACAQLIADCSELTAADPDLVWRVRGSHQLSPPALGVLRELWRWRETEAIGANKPPFFILSPEVMVDLAHAAVAGRPLQEILPRHLTPRRRGGVLHAVTAGLAVKHPPALLRHRGLRQTEAEKRRLIALEDRRNRCAAELGLDPTLIASRAMLIALSNDWAAHEHELMPWQRELLQG